MAADPRTKGFRGPPALTIGKLIKIGAAGLGRSMEQIAKIGAHITAPDCATTGTVKNIQEGGGDAVGQDSHVDLRDWD